MTLNLPSAGIVGIYHNKLLTQPLSGIHSYLDQEVLLGVMMQWGDGSLGTKPGIDSDLFLFSVAQATVIGDADVLFQLWDLMSGRKQKSGIGMPARTQLMSDCLTEPNTFLDSLSCF